MKIVNSISKIYNEKQIECEMLRTEVNNRINTIKKQSWHYFSRIKTIESFALKLEMARDQDPRQVEDFFACTLVVENLNEIKNAISAIEQEFDIKYRRPKDESLTHKESSAFPFDDLRLYVSLKTVAYLPPSSLDLLVFEIQIKTFLQHAWSIATHDLIYKSNNINWPKERVAYQIKAMLEQAELSISGVEELSKLNEISKSNKQSDRLNELIAFLNEVFPLDALPNDLKRLSTIVSDTLFFFNIRLQDLRSILQSETELNRGVLTLNLSPYGIILQSIINQKPDIFTAALNSKHEYPFKKLFIPMEIELNGIDIRTNPKIIAT